MLVGAPWLTDCTYTTPCSCLTEGATQDPGDCFFYTLKGGEEPPVQVEGPDVIWLAGLRPA